MKTPLITHTPTTPRKGETYPKGRQTRKGRQTTPDGHSPHSDLGRKRVDPPPVLVCLTNFKQIEIMLHCTSDIPCPCDVTGVLLLSVVSSSSSMEHNKSHHHMSDSLSSP